MANAVNPLPRHEKALANFEAALAVESGDVNALNNRAATLMRLKRHDEALAAYERLLAKQPDHLDALNNCGGLNVRLGRPDAALACYDRALAVAPALAELHINKGTALRALNRFDEALASFVAAAAIDPQRAEAHYNASLVRLCLGEFQAGWRDYEWRWRKADWASKRRNFMAPLWLGHEPIDGKTILLHAEQGFGDTIQFARYVPLVARRGANVILECQAELTPLLGNLGSLAQIVAHGAPLPAFDLHCPLLSLPLAFGTVLETIPNVVPYLNAPQPYSRKWADRLARISPLRVGLIWAGNSAHLNDHNRSIPLHLIEPMLALERVHFVSLQKAMSPADLARLKQRGNVTLLGDELGDFADTAAVMAMLDLVITVDTAAAHLAGAMGKAVGLLVPFAPDWRWMAERTDSPWYPTMRLFRQTAIGDWRAPLERMYRELAAVAARACG